jgi:hypothetical protein
MQRANLFEFEDGDVQVWVEQESIHLRACDGASRDPVEITCKTVRQLAEKLKELADIIDD